MSRRRGGYPVWSDSAGSVEVRFVGRGPDARRSEVLRRADSGGRDLAWLDQRHSSRCVEARPGPCGEGDALWTRRSGLALCVATADCVPVVIGHAEPARGVAVIHAGWRGVRAGVIGAAARALGEGGGGRTAWIGPAVGSCCYEVGEEVAQSVVAASSPEVERPGANGRPHLDLAGAVEWQLRQEGVAEIHRLGPCTKCSPELLWSYRREGAGAGRNLTFAWIAPAGA